MDEKELKLEESYLESTIGLLEKKIDELGGNLEIDSAKITEFNKFIFKEIGSMDKFEIRSNLLSSEMEYTAFLRKSNYLKKLLHIRDKPYFGRIDFTSDKYYKVYIGITYLTDDDNDTNIIYDWRAPISSLFYQSENGFTSYLAPEGIIEGELTLKRQYKIYDRKLIRVFDNNLNITDDVLQQVLSNNSSNKMKNIVNTIQEEQNDIIRNITDKNLIVSGIAGSGKTSVALHRIAYLLYQIPNLKSSDILIFSPNNIFSEYISNVLPELGEDNTLETTFSDFQKAYIKEYKQVESFPSFIARFYQKTVDNAELVKIKQSDSILEIIELYVKRISKSIKFIDNFKYNLIEVSKLKLNELLMRYEKLTLMDRFNKIAEYICEQNEISYKKYGRTFVNQLYTLANFEKDYKKIYYNFYKSTEFSNYYRELSDSEISSFVNNKEILYEDSLLFIYIKGLLNDFPYSYNIKQVVIDEAQDYNRIQYLILTKIFKRASFTILGDTNQTINPYYHYESLEDLKDVFEDIKYLSLTKTYRSSPEIIEVANKILGLDHVVAVRLDNNKPVIRRRSENVNDLINDIKIGTSNYQKVAIITKNDDETNYLYQELKDQFNISNMLNSELIINPNLIIIPCYLAKGLEFDYVIVYTDINNKYLDVEKYLYYVAVTRAQHELIIYNQE